jgi:hypothetical protein
LYLAELYIAEKIGNLVKNSFYKMSNFKLESKNCKQATPYARPSPAIAEIFGASSTQTSFGTLDLGSSQKQKKGTSMVPNT